jgi:hypothetical protein
MPHEGDLARTLAARALEIRGAILELEESYQGASALEFRRLCLQLFTLLASVVDELAGGDTQARLAMRGSAISRNGARQEQPVAGESP